MEQERQSGDAGPVEVLWDEDAVDDCAEEQAAHHDEGQHPPETQRPEGGGEFGEFGFQVSHGDSGQANGFDFSSILHSRKTRDTNPSAGLFPAFATDFPCLAEMDASLVGAPDFKPECAALILSQVGSIPTRLRHFSIISVS